MRVISSNSKYSTSPQVVAVCEDGMLYTYSLDVEHGDECMPLKRHRFVHTRYHLLLQSLTYALVFEMYNWSRHEVPQQRLSCMYGLFTKSADWRCR